MWPDAATGCGAFVTRERVLFMILMSLFFMIDALGAVVQDALLDAVKFEYLWPTLTYEAEIFTISLLQIWDKLVS